MTAAPGSGRVVRKALRFEVPPGACMKCGGDGFIRIVEVWDGPPSPEWLALAPAFPQEAELNDGTKATVAGYPSVQVCKCKRDAEQQRAQKQATSKLSARGQEQVFETWNSSKSDIVQTFPGNERRIGALELMTWVPKDGRGLFFTGLLGVGKTHLLNAIAQRLIVRGIASLVLNLNTLLEHERRAMDTAGARRPVDDAIAAPVLFLDELGGPRLTSWVAETLYRLVDERLEAKRPTIWATNLSDAMWEEYWSAPRVPEAEAAHARMNAQRIARRITDGCERRIRVEKKKEGH